MVCLYEYLTVNTIPNNSSWNERKFFYNKRKILWVISFLRLLLLLHSVLVSHTRCCLFVRLFGFVIVIIEIYDSIVVHHGNNFSSKYIFLARSLSSSGSTNQSIENRPTSSMTYSYIGNYLLLRINYDWTQNMPVYFFFFVESFAKSHFCAGPSASRCSNTESGYPKPHLEMRQTEGPITSFP